MRIEWRWTWMAEAEAEAEAGPVRREFYCTPTVNNE